jgi:hypothetical protein
MTVGLECSRGGAIERVVARICCTISWSILMRFAAYERILSWPYYIAKKYGDCKILRLCTLSLKNP